MHKYNIGDRVRITRFHRFHRFQKGRETRPITCLGQIVTIKCHDADWDGVHSYNVEEKACSWRWCL